MSSQSGFQVRGEHRTVVLTTLNMVDDPRIWSDIHFREDIETDNLNATDRKTTSSRVGQTLRTSPICDELYLRAITSNDQNWVRH